MSILAMRNPVAWLAVWAMSLLDRLTGCFKSSPTGRPVQTGVSHTGPRNAVLVLDVSPSMEDTDWKPSRLHAAMEAAIAYCRRLAEEEPQARVAIVAYGGSAKVVCGLTQASAFDALVAHIRQLAIIGRTNITDGLVEAYRLLEGLAPCQVVLLTDGHHNTGPRPDGVSHHLQRLAAIECVGIGGSPKDVDEPLLKAIASTRPDGTKRYRWIGQKEDLIEHFRNLGGGLSRA